MKKAMYFSWNTVGSDAMARNVHTIMDAENLSDNNAGGSCESRKDSRISFC
jgi:hypothetical protein